jgi:hypothetical protein
MYDPSPQKKGARCAWSIVICVVDSIGGGWCSFNRQYSGTFRNCQITSYELSYWHCSSALQRWWEMNRWISKEKTSIHNSLLHLHIYNPWRSGVCTRWPMKPIPFSLFD